MIPLVESEWCLGNVHNVHERRDLTFLQHGIVFDSITIRATTLVSAFFYGRRMVLIWLIAQLGPSYKPHCRHKDWQRAKRKWMRILEAEGGEVYRSVRKPSHLHPMVSQVILQKMEAAIEKNKEWMEVSPKNPFPHYWKSNEYIVLCGPFALEARQRQTAGHE